MAKKRKPPRFPRLLSEEEAQRQYFGENYTMTPDLPLPPPEPPPEPVVEPPKVGSRPFLRLIKSDDPPD